MATKVTREIWGKDPNRARDFGVSLDLEFGGPPSASIRYEDSFSIIEMEAIERGHTPQLIDVDDDWVLWCEGDTLYVNQRTSGSLHFRVRLERTQAGASVAAAEGNYHRPHLAQFLRFLIRGTLLGEDVPCPPEQLTKEERREEMRSLFLSRWPQIESRLPESLEYVAASGGPRRFMGLVSAARAPVWRWLFSRGGGRFLESDVPDTFTACLVQHRGNSENLILMWRKGSRRFWFSSAWVVFLYNTEDRLAIVSDELDRALERWDRGDKVVIYGDHWGWYDVGKGAFENDDDQPMDRTPGESAHRCDEDERRMTSAWDEYYRRGPIE